MKLIEIFKLVSEEIYNYYTAEIFTKSVTIDGQVVNINFNLEKLSNISENQDFEKFIENIIEQVNHLRHKNQVQLEQENFKVKNFGGNEIILSSLYTAYESLFEAFKNIIFLSNRDANFITTSINEKFALRKISALSLTLVSKYVQLPARLKKNVDLEEIIEMVKELNTKEKFSEVEVITNQILEKHRAVLKSGEVICEGTIDEEYSWIQDVVKMAKVNAEVVGLLVYTEIYAYILKNNYYS
ncbi:hypothetical protein SCLARK_00452 [Spiroplasma clarkii]|uniref:Uncharacterized protein n=1 Tax=Spiroplasma clarkii TaxID=2139 RepID=A0A1Y0L0D2_9MOLU|nr:hypothetical protein [Spiroplasma clarkii]ARU91168.1 hypothetical protein SCLARK_00452 [Spiroplasma clarkii]ATX70608.1 hypothetical protein SCLAR_v1c02780 [Spiroplasma clarkii]